MILRAGRCFLGLMITTAPMGVVAANAPEVILEADWEQRQLSAEAFPTATRDASGWMSSQWFGWWWDASDPWLFHIEHGWIYRSSGNEVDGLMLYDTHLRAWVFTSMDSYSWFYAFAPISDWVWYSRPGAPGGRWYFEASNWTWKHESDLRRPKSVGFANPDSDVAALSLPQKEGEPTMVVFRNEASGNARHTVFAYDDGRLLELIADAEGRVGQVTVNDHVFIFTDYTATTARLVYHAPDGSTVEQVVSLDAGAIQMAARDAGSTWGTTAALSEDSTLDALLEDAVLWLEDPGNTHILLNIYNVAGEAVVEELTELSSGIDQVATRITELVRVASNRMSCLSETGRLCAEELAEAAPELVDGLEQLSAYDQTAGFNIGENGVKPRREEWDPLIVNGQISTEFTMTNVPCEESVFAEMNPNCPQYIPPQTEPTDPTDPTDPNPPEGALQAHDLILFTPSDTPISQELGASGATSYEITSQPGSGILSLENPASGAFTYQPDAGFEGIVTFTFVALNGDKRSNEAMVTINVSGCLEFWQEALIGTWEVTGLPEDYNVEKFTLEFEMRKDAFGFERLYMSETSHYRSGGELKSPTSPPTLLTRTWDGVTGCWLKARYVLLGNGEGGSINAQIYISSIEPRFFDITIKKK